MIWLLLYIIFLTVLLKIILRCTCGICTSDTCLIGKTAIVTGGNAGIGCETAVGLAARGCRVIIASRTCDANFAEKIIKCTNNPNVVAKKLDLASFKSVRDFAEDIIKTEDRLDILINNAGAGGFGNRFTEDGLEMAMQVNHFGPFLLTHLLTDLLKKTAPSRIIFATSLGAITHNLTLAKLKDPYEKRPATWRTDWEVYYNSKFCNIIAAVGFAEKLKGTGVTSNAVHPGLVRSNLIPSIFVQHVPKNVVDFVFGFVGYFLKTPREGAQTALHMAMAKEVEQKTRSFYMECCKIPIPSQIIDEELSKCVWKESEKLVKLQPEELL